MVDDDQFGRRVAEGLKRTFDFVMFPLLGLIFAGGVGFIAGIIIAVLLIIARKS